MKGAHSQTVIKITRKMVVDLLRLASPQPSLELLQLRTGGGGGGGVRMKFLIRLTTPAVNRTRFVILFDHSTEIHHKSVAVAVVHCCNNNAIII